MHYSTTRSISDINLHPEGLDDNLKDAIIQSYTSQDWCDSVSTLLTTDTFLPVNVQETLLESFIVLKAVLRFFRL